MTMWTMCLGFAVRDRHSDDSSCADISSHRDITVAMPLTPRALVRCRRRSPRTVGRGGRTRDAAPQIQMRCSELSAGAQQ